MDRCRDKVRRHQGFTLKSGHLGPHEEIIISMKLRTTIVDLVELFKPTITGLSVMMAGVGLWLAPVSLEWWTTCLILMGVGLQVGSANALNMYVERDSDGLMSRTRNRPLPAGRMNAVVALCFGILLSIAGTAVLAYAAGPLTTYIGLAALLGYVCVYTPLKRKSPLALVVGAIPGAAPPLMGWTAATQEIELPGLVLFGIVFLWQMPHFISIAMYRKQDYAAAHIKVVPIVRGSRVAKVQSVIWATALIPCSVLLLPLDVAGNIYGIGAGLLSVAYLCMCLREWNSIRDAIWGRRVLLASLVYLPALVLVLLVDRLVG
jgi:protoheme IX farnesyltransferase